MNKLRYRGPTAFKRGDAETRRKAKLLPALTNIFAESFKVGTNDPRLLVGAPLLLAALAMLACYVPARGAAKVDPLKAVREE